MTAAKILSIVLLLIIAAAPAAASLSITYTPTFERQELMPVLLVSIENTGDTIYNVSTFLNYSGLLLDKSPFMTGSYTFSTELGYGERQYFQIPFKFMDSKDDITVTTNIKYNGTERVDVQFTVPAVIVINIQSVEWQQVLYPFGILLLLAVILILVCARKRLT